MTTPTTRIVLRATPRDPDAETWFRWINLAEWQYYDEPDAEFKPVSREEFEEAQQNRPSRPSNPRRYIDTRDGRFIGWVNSYEQDSRFFVGIVLPEEDTWNQGYGTAALRAWIDLLFEETVHDELWLATWTGNTRMMRCAEKCGFRERARMPHRAPVSVRGEPLERVEFAITRDAWLASQQDDA
jgi:RimJ/RimL family protein N-acetyltransferase